MLGTVNQKILAQMVNGQAADRLDTSKKSRGKRSNVLPESESSAQSPGGDDAPINKIKESPKPPTKDFKSFLSKKIRSISKSQQEFSDGPENPGTIDSAQATDRIGVNPVLPENERLMNKMSPEISETMEGLVTTGTESNQAESLKTENETIHQPSQFSVAASIPDVTATPIAHTPGPDEKNPETKQEIPLQFHASAPEQGQNKAVQLDKGIEPDKNQENASTANSETKTTPSGVIFPGKETPPPVQQANIAGNQEIRPEPQHPNVNLQSGPSHPANRSAAEEPSEVLRSEPSVNPKANPPSDLERPARNLLPSDKDVQSSVLDTDTESAHHKQIPRGFEVRNVESALHAAEPADRASVSAVQAPSRTGTPHAETLQQDARPVDQILRHISAMAVSQAPQRISVTLSPQYLGAVRMTFQHEGDGIIGVLQAQKAETRREIEESLPQLISSMQNSGIQVRRVEVVQWGSNQHALKDDLTGGLDSSMKQEFFHSTSENASHRQMSKRNPFGRPVSDIVADERGPQDPYPSASGLEDAGLNLLI